MLEAVRERSERRAGRPGPVRVAVVGCGAISRGYHVPVLAGHEGVRLEALVDRDMERAKALAQAYGVGTVLADASSLTPGQVDGVIVATPPSHHASCCIGLLRRGLHVLVEKPMSVTADEAAAMADAAREAGVVLAAGYFRRLFPSVRLLLAALDQGVLGPPVGFDAEEGDEYTWGLATLSNLRKDQGGGGVLIDLGSHVLDLLLSLFHGPFELLECRHNALGGVETDCLLRLRLQRDGRPVEGRVTLSRTRKLRSSLRVVCERGTLELRTGERYKVAVIPDGVTLEDPARDAPRAFGLQASWADEPESPGYEAYRAEIDDWLTAIRDGGQPQLCASSARRTVELIETCYRRAEPLYEPWVWEGVPGGHGRSAEGRPGELSVAEPAAAGVSRGNGSPRRVLVTGAAGFIGCRVAEVLQLGGDWQVRALVHRPSSAARLARLPVEMVQGDLRSPESVARAVRGCDAVVHCAIGTAYGQRREIFAVTVDGTRRLVEAAQAAGVERFVHLSSIAVHGNDVRGVLDESTPVRPPRGDDYSESKAAAERAVMRAALDGLSAVVLRPGNVYGPFSRTFSVRPIQYLKRGRLVLVGSADTPSNTVYVDNLVRAIVRALEAPAEVADGQPFTIGGGDEMTWGEFYGYFARRMGAELIEAPPEPAGAARRGGRWPLGWVRSWYQGGITLVKSPEFRGLGRRFLQTDPVGRLPRSLLERSPSLERRLLRLLGTDTAVIYRRGAAEAEDLLRVRPRPAQIRTDRARRLLGYEPAVDRDRAMGLTWEWLRDARIA
jgi:predicted dehydrogenase/nucleoside-diphosphate-sugar epimerase